VVLEAGTQLVQAGIQFGDPALREGLSAEAGFIIRVRPLERNLGDGRGVGIVT
jgi:hypothetical protein